jgi:serine/threonine protein kinase
MQIHNVYPRAKLISEGAYGSVYNTEELYNNKDPFVVKVQAFNLSDKRGSSLPEAVFNECAVLKSCVSENVVKVFDIQHHYQAQKEECWLLLELAQEDLWHFCRPFNFGTPDQQKQHRPDTKILIECALDILKGLEYIHAHNIVNLDLKPSNILRFQQGTKKNIFKLSDFGLAEKQIVSKRRFQEKVTIDFRPPEILCAANNVQFTTSVDMWSFGIILTSIFFGMSNGLFSRMYTIQAAKQGKRVSSLPPDEPWELFTQICKVIGNPDPGTATELGWQGKYMVNSDACSKGVMIANNPKFNAKFNLYHNKLCILYEKVYGKEIYNNIIDLISQCLKWYPNQRITAAHALRHDIFKSLVPTTGYSITTDIWLDNTQYLPEDTLLDNHLSFLSQYFPRHRDILDHNERKYLNCIWKNYIYLKGSPDIFNEMGPTQLETLIVVCYSLVLLGLTEAEKRWYGIYNYITKKIVPLLYPPAEEEKEEKTLPPLSKKQKTATDSSSSSSNPNKETKKQQENQVFKAYWKLETSIAFFVNFLIYKDANRVYPDFHYDPDTARSVAVDQAFDNFLLGYP